MLFKLLQSAMQVKITSKPSDWATNYAAYQSSPAGLGKDMPGGGNPLIPLTSNEEITEASDALEHATKPVLDQLERKKAEVCCSDSKLQSKVITLVSDSGFLDPSTSSQSGRLHEDLRH